MIGAHEADALRQTRGDMGEILILAGGIDDQHQDAVLRLLGRARHHQIVENAALLVEELRVSLASGSEVQDIGRHERFERLGGRRMVAPMRKAWPICETSKRPALARVWRCSARTPVGYCTGMS